MNKEQQTEEIKNFYLKLASNQEDSNSDDSDTDINNNMESDVDSCDSEEITDPEQIYNRFKTCDICNRYMIPNDVDADWGSIFSGCCYNEIITDASDENDDTCKNCEEEFEESYDSEDEENIIKEDVDSDD